jgi:HD superfamily phosphohydrolase
VVLAGLCHNLGHGPYSHLWKYHLREAEEDQLNNPNIKDQAQAEANPFSSNRDENLYYNAGTKGDCPQWN